MTVKQQRFVEEYLKDFKLVEAARRAGYSKRTAKDIAQALLKKPEILALVEEKQQEIRDQNNITRDYYIQKLRKIVDDTDSRNNEITNALTLMAKITGHIKEVASDTKPIVILNQTGLLVKDDETPIVADHSTPKPLLN